MGFQLFLPEYSCSLDAFGSTRGTKTTGDLCRIQTWTGSCGSDWGDDKDSPDSSPVLVRRKACIYSQDASYEPRMCELPLATVAWSTWTYCCSKESEFVIYTNFGLTEQTGLNLYSMAILSTGLNHTQLATTWSTYY